MSTGWLPPLVLLKDFGGDLDAYGEALYDWFKKDFLDSLPAWPGKRVGLKRLPLRRGKVATYWHFLTSGEDEDERNVDMLRCERIRWPRPTMESFLERRPQANDRILWWRNQRAGEWRYVLALPDLSYVVVVADRGEYVLPWTQYCVVEDHQRRKLHKEYESYWKAQKC